MRKQTKIAAVVSAAALLALGASITSFAAAKGTWMMTDGEWYCYDKNGDVYTNTFCSSNGKEYYVGDDGAIVTSSWVDYDGNKYFVNSSGAKVTNDWRLTTAMDDENGEEQWFYFQSTGKMAENKKILYNGKTYYFDSEGKMLTGWVTADGKDVVNEENEIDASYTFYCDETGARVEYQWVYTTAPTTADNDVDADEYWYFLKKGTGKVATGKVNNIKGQSYILGNQASNRGQLLTGWVANTANGYEEVGTEDSGYKVGDDDTLYFAPYGGEYDGHVKKNQWVKTWRPDAYYEEDQDNDMYCYFLEKDGKTFIPTASIGKAYKYGLTDGALEQKKVLDSLAAFDIAKKKIGSKDYLFNLEGEMLSNFIEVVDSTEIAEGMYYYGGSSDGVMKTGAQSIKDENGDVYKFYFGTKNSELETKGVGVTGNKNNKLYYMGHLVAATDYKYQPVEFEFVDDNGQENTAIFIVNQNGTIQHSNVEYKEDGEVLINAKNYKADADEGLAASDVEFFKSGWMKYAINVNDSNMLDQEGNRRIIVDNVDPTKIMKVTAYEAASPNSPTNN